MIIQDLFQNKLNVDDREALFTFSLPFTGGVELGFFNFNVEFYIQLLMLVVIGGTFCCMLWTITYHVIIPCRNRGSMTQAYLIGFGVVCPLMFWFPPVLLEFLDIRNFFFVL